MLRQKHLSLIFGVTASIAISAWSAATSADDPVLAAPPSVSLKPRLIDEQWREAVACWRRLVRTDVHSVRRTDIGRLTIDRFLESAHARALVSDLCDLLTDHESGKLMSRITVRFVDEVPSSFDAPDGSFLPRRAGAENYEVLVLAQYKNAVADPEVFVFGEYPDNPDCGYVFFYRQAASSMAQTLFHELLHVWFVNKFAGEDRLFVTGHGLVTRCEFEEDFLELLSANAAELSTIEGHPPLNFESATRPSVGTSR